MTQDCGALKQDACTHLYACTGKLYRKTGNWLPWNSSPRCCLRDAFGAAWFRSFNYCVAPVISNQINSSSIYRRKSFAAKCVDLRGNYVERFWCELISWGLLVFLVLLIEQHWLLKNRILRNLRTKMLQRINIFWIHVSRSRYWLSNKSLMGKLWSVFHAAIIDSQQRSHKYQYEYICTGSWIYRLHWSQAGLKTIYVLLFMLHIS